MNRWISMSNYDSLELYKGGTADEFREIAEQVLKEYRADPPPEDQPPETLNLEFESCGDVHAIHASATYGVNWRYSARLRRARGGVSIEVNLPDCCWDYTLYEGDQVVDRFSTWPEQWENAEDPGYQDRLRERAGNPVLFAKLWGLPVERIERYFQQWGEAFDAGGEFIGHKLIGKAYPTDNFEYGDGRQFFDFVEVLGYLRHVG